MGNEKKIKWSTLAFMCFSTLWGFGNVLNGFVYFNGVQVIFSWLLMFGLYFIPYVNKMEGNPSKEFPKSIIFATVMVIVSAIFGTIAMGMMFDVNAVNANFDSYVANGSYWAFQRLGEYYGVGNIFLIIYAACNAIGQFAVLLLSIDAPLRMLLEDPNSSKFIPKSLLKKNKHGAYVNGIWMVVVLSGSIILAQILVPGADTVLKQLIKLNAVMMPLRYLWVFFAYISLKKLIGKFSREYHFTKSNGLGKTIGAWCFIVTLACCILWVLTTM